MKEDSLKVRICNKCGKSYFGRPIPSRLDNTVLVCPDCGAREALEGLGIGAEEQGAIIAAMHRHGGR